MSQIPRSIGPVGLLARKEHTMFDQAQLIGLVMAVAVLVIVPGPNTILILAHSLDRGRAAVSVGETRAIGQSSRVVAGANPYQWPL